LRRRVHDVGIIFVRMGDVDARGLAMDRRVIEATFPSMRGKLDVAQEAEAHRGACSNLALPSTLRRQYVEIASYAGNWSRMFSKSSFAFSRNPRAIASRPAPSGRGFRGPASAARTISDISRRARSVSLYFLMIASKLHRSSPPSL